MENNDGISEIDKAIAKAQASKSKRAKLTGDATEQKEQAPTRAKRTDEEKAASRAARQVEQDRRAEERRVARAARQQARATEKQTPHMKKIERAASRLPELSQEARLAFNDATANLSAADVATLAAHLQHFNRVAATGRAVGAVAPTVGAQVTIVGGDPRYAGKTGVVTKAQRIRCYVEVPGVNKPLYLFISDVQVVNAEQATGTNG